MYNEGNNLLDSCLFRDLNSFLELIQFGVNICLPKVEITGNWLNGNMCPKPTTQHIKVFCQRRCRCIGQRGIRVQRFVTALTVFCVHCGN